MSSRLKTKLERRCIACGSLLTKSQLWRLVRMPSGKVEVDLGDRDLMGRSAYVCRHQTCLDLARKKKAWGRSLKTAVDQELLQQLHQLQAQLHN
ncbi:MAG: YlxR family protein [Pseudanabaenaceae cyanobacterium bins.68]|nr:YlxR family protein [Pseudanabaenaceae cyanobacterium bins.68]